MLKLKTREQLAELNAQAWADFKAHWPMHVLEICRDAGTGTLLGVALGLALVIEVLPRTW
jgi:hypothetical protein